MLADIAPERPLAAAQTLPLVAAQPGIWMAEQLAAASNAYVVAQYVELNGRLDVACFSAAVRLGLAEADLVHARFVETEEGPAQLVPNDVQAVDLPEPELVDLTDEADPAGAARRLMRDDLETPRTLAGEAPLYRHMLFRLSAEGSAPGGAERWFWFQRYHHLSVDGYGFTAIARRVSEIYTALRRGLAPSPSPFVSFAEVVKEYAAYDGSPAQAADRRFWAEHARDLPQAVTLSSRRAPADGKFTLPLRERIVLDAQTTALLSAHATAGRVSVGVMAMAAVALYLRRMTGAARLSVGAHFMRRMGSVALHAVGPVVNVLPLQIAIDADMCFLDVAAALGRELDMVRRRQRYEAELLRRDLGFLASGRALHGPLLNFKMFDYRLDFAGVEGITHQLASGPVEDIEFDLYLAERELIVDLVANGARYGERELELHALRLARFARRLAESPQTPIGEIALMTESETALIAEANDTRRAIPPASVCDLLEAQAERTPDAPALIDRRHRLAYREMRGQVARLALALAAAGVVRGDRVAVALPRSVHLSLALMAALEAGAAYLPLDTSYPDERLAYMVEDAAPRLIVTNSALRGRFETMAPVLIFDVLAVIEADASPARVASPSPEDAAYVIYTSGSTGRPKGVVVPHGAVVNLLLWLQHEYRLTSDDVVLQKTPCSFDVSVGEFFWPLTAGARLVMAPPDVDRDPAELLRVIREHRVTTLNFVPSLLSAFVAAARATPGAEAEKTSLRRVFCIGEPLSRDLAEAFERTFHAPLHNVYGPTEATVEVTYQPAFGAALATAEGVGVPVGRPLWNCGLRVLDARLRPVPIGVAGDLYLTGAQLAQYYWRRPSLTASRFVADPEGDGERMYRTGDIARWLPSGVLDFLGRNDDQLKIRGQRIELGEIESALLEQPGVGRAAAVARLFGSAAGEGDARQIVAYVTPDAPEGALDPEALRAALARRLPAYMTPVAIVVLEAFPLGASGKLDRKALPDPSVDAPTARPPAPGLETLLAEIFVEVLRLETVGAQDDFFFLGGDSISAIGLCAALRKRGYMLRPRDVFERRSVAGMAAVLRRVDQDARTLLDDGVSAATVEALRARHGAIAAVLPALPLQEGLLFHARLGDSASRYNAVSRFDLDGPLDVGRLRDALEALLRRHPQLAAIFDVEQQGRAFQILPLVEGPQALRRWPWSEHRLEGFSAQERTASLDRIEREELARDVLAESGGRRMLARAVLVRLSEESHALLVVCHHLIGDGWSSGVMLRDLLDAYAGAALAPILPDYSSVVRRLAARDPEPARAAWREALAGAAPTLLFDPAAAFGETRELPLALRPGLAKQLEAFGRRRGSTLATLLQGVFAAFLGAMTGRYDIVFGAPVSGRSEAEAGLDAHIGLFTNTLPVRVRLRPDQPLALQLTELQSRQIALMEHDGLGLGEIQRLAGASTLFDTLLVVENYPDDARFYAEEFAGLRLVGARNRSYSHYPLTLMALPGRELELRLEYREGVAEPERLGRRIVRLLEQLVDAPETPLASLDLLTPDERATIVAVNDTRVETLAATLCGLLEEQAWRTPHAPALIDADHELSYAQLRGQIAQLARGLAAAGVGRGDLVAVALPRSARLSIALMAAQQAGAAYLPLDTSYPDERLRYMVEDGAPRLIVTDEASRSRFEGLAPLLAFDRLPQIDEAEEADFVSPAKPDDPAYVIYTSGSTGRPKGVVVSHRAIVNRLLWMQHEYGLGAGDVVLQKTPSSFDVSVWEFFWPLMAGAALVMAPPEAHRDPAEILRLIRAHRVTTLHFVPSMLAAFVSATDAARAAEAESLRRVFCSGEALSRELAEDFEALFGAPLHNLYGPTEAAVDVTYQPAFGAALAGLETTGVPIGRPVWNTGVRVLDSWLRETPIGVAGDLYLTGVQLADGYLRRPSLTASRFVADPQAVGERMYRTGDIVRRRPDGALDYLGRGDDQIKIRGQRIELGEIESVLAEQPGVEQAAVVARASAAGGLAGADERRLVGYVVAGVEIDVEALRRAVAQRLPAHMTPTAIVRLPEFPLSASGKLDRKALPEPEAAPRRDGRKPTPGVEIALADLFARALGVDQLDADDDFFALGGHSLLAMRLAADIQREMKVSVSVGQLMAAPSVESLARELFAERREEDRRAGFAETLCLRAGEGPPLVCIHPASGFSWQFGVLTRYLRSDWPVIALQSPRPSGPIASCRNMEEVCDRHLATLREIQPHGPYRLLGYSLGGVVAQAIAARLSAEGEEIAFLGLLDTYPSEIQDWSKPLDAAGEEEIEREKALFMDASQEALDSTLAREKAEMFGHIMANYEDSVRLLASARTPRYEGEATLFVALRTLPEGMDVEETWRPYVGALKFVAFDCPHTEIISPRMLRELGPALNEILVAIDAKRGLK
ncbi:amino acid adenylation domain-containing protein [Methylosinus sp. sav-2]|uniref:non-ribosomal peptide synthetase n=1 Tax=Methylosinus sp. sav-2 TaxID=2485168 RepID=UPI0010E69182|nr:non-ribosomal peptide synthetase [Methylosinus sp. sav-2]TDX62534.1 amino acid adenylation domain-containing protein [Methylosinus sp. sav-2]